MSAILGVVHLEGGPADAAEQATMAAGLAHLGPDHYSEVGPQGALLGHLSNDSGPAEASRCRAVTDGHGVYLTADLRLDNRDELVARLGLANAGDPRPSGSEVLLAAYRRWGVDCARELLGDFAFALWDEKRQRLLLARDHFGIRPLFYTRVGPVLYFASALLGLLAAEHVGDELDERMLARYLIFSNSNSGDTLYRGVRALVPRHTLVVERGGDARVEPYWQPDRHRRVRYRDDRDYVEHYRELLTRAVRSRVAGSRRPAVMVSGGLDSSTLAALAAGEHAAGPVTGLSHVVEPDSPQAGFDERSHLEALERHVANLDIRFVTATGTSPLGGTERAYEVLQAPVQAGLDYVQKALLTAAADTGTDVVLMGAGGDEIVSANCPDHAFSLLRRLRWFQLAHELRARRERGPFSASAFWRRALMVQMPRTLWHRLHRWRRGYLGGFRTGLQEAAARRLDLRPELTKSSFWDVTGYVRPDTRRMLYETVLWMCDEGVDLHGWVTDAVTFGQELRFPMADLRLVEYCLAVPPEQHRRHGVGRRLIRRATEGLLPTSIRDRMDKVAFGPDYAARVRQGSSRLESAFARFRSIPEVERLVDFESVGRALERVVDSGQGNRGLAADCLQILLPVFYLGRFLELDASGDRVREPMKRVVGRSIFPGDGDDRLLV